MSAACWTTRRSARRRCYPPPVLPLGRLANATCSCPLSTAASPRWRAPWPPAATDDLSRARAIERHLRTDYGYTLELPDREMADPLANFLFVRRKGHCEYFASSMAVMLRASGFPRAWPPASRAAYTIR